MEKERVILGENCCYSSDCNETGLNNNIIVCGGSGSGKTMSISEPRLLETKTSSLISTVSPPFFREILDRVFSQYDIISHRISTNTLIPWLINLLNLFTWRIL